VTGFGGGITEEAFRHKVKCVRTAITVNRPDPDDPVDILAKVGGLDLAAMCGVFLGCARYQIPVVIDGLISAAAALCAVRLCPAAREAMLASHVSAEPAARMLLEALELQAPITAGMHLGEGSGAVALLPLLDLALSVYHSGQTFDKLGIAAYEPQNEKLC
jgi:nicotinate-nucleotide--dimethylbenzimidazole phosphoribosyltransferase